MSKSNLPVLYQKPKKHLWKLVVICLGFFMLVPAISTFAWFFSPTDQKQETAFQSRGTGVRGVTKVRTLPMGSYRLVFDGDSATIHVASGQCVSIPPAGPTFSYYFYPIGKSRPVKYVGQVRPTFDRFFVRGTGKVQFTLRPYGTCASQKPA